MATVEREIGRRFGDRADPLLVSVRSGAAASMPGTPGSGSAVGSSTRTIVIWCGVLVAVSV